MFFEIFSMMLFLLYITYCGPKERGEGEGDGVPSKHSDPDLISDLTILELFSLPAFRLNSRNQYHISGQTKFTFNITITISLLMKTQPGWIIQDLYSVLCLSFILKYKK